MVRARVRHLRDVSPGSRHPGAAVGRSASPASPAASARARRHARRSSTIRMIPTTARPTPTVNRSHGLEAGLSASRKNAATADTKPATTRSQANACFTGTLFRAVAGSAPGRTTALHRIAACPSALASSARSIPPETLQRFHDCSSCRRRLALDHSWDVSVGMAGGESSRPPTGLNGGECEPETTRRGGRLKVLPGTAPLFAAFRRAGWKAAPAHLLEPRAPADQLCLREANLGFARRAVERQGERLELLL